jgi:hypothetical protein
LKINKTVIAASSWCSVLLYLQWCCTVAHKSSLGHELCALCESWYRLYTNHHTVHTFRVPTLHDCSQHNQAYTTRTFFI